MEVWICRHPYDNEGGIIDAGEIRGVHWDNVSGGCQKKQSGYSLYGYISYGLAKELVNCSGSHEKYGNDAKICIPKKQNQSPEFVEGYRELLGSAKNDKPESTIKKNRPEGFPPCTKCIMQIMENEQEITRKMLRERIQYNKSTGKRGYKVSTISAALRILKKQGKIKFIDGNKSIIKADEK